MPPLRCSPAMPDYERPTSAKGWSRNTAWVSFIISLHIMNGAANDWPTSGLSRHPQDQSCGAGDRPPLPSTIADGKRAGHARPPSAHAAHRLSEQLLLRGAAALFLGQSTGSTSQPIPSNCVPDRYPSSCIASRHLPAWRAAIVHAKAMLERRGCRRCSGSRSRGIGISNAQADLAAPGETVLRPVGTSTEQALREALNLPGGRNPDGRSPDDSQSDRRSRRQPGDREPRHSNTCGTAGGAPEVARLSWLRCPAHPDGREVGAT